MTTARIELPPKLVDVFQGSARYRGAYGGRGSGKSRSFALMSAVWGYRAAMQGESGVILCAREHLNSLSDSSMSEIKAAISSEPWLAAAYDVGEQYIRTKDRRITYAFAGLRHNLDSIKSKARLLLCWVDEAERVSESAWAKLVPTVREEGSEIWVTWNPESDASATHKRFRGSPPPDAKITELNWRDNPWFPGVLDAERLADMSARPDSYDHVWEGGFVQAVDGAYYAASLTAARAEGRVGFVARDPVLPLRAYWDLGVSDATAIWIAQRIGTEMRVLDYYEAEGQPLAAHLDWLRRSGYGAALCVLPHDGAHRDTITASRFDEHVRAGGFDVETVPNMGKGAAMRRIEAGRRVFPFCRFDAVKCEPGLKALGWYHERVNDVRRIGLGPEHDWSSHGADAFGLMAAHYEAPPAHRPAPKIIAPVGGWMG